ncbi:unnamed protein product [Gordionus sp. m RMFG-2023]|uniref:erbin-like n=1 Tax=Gordionus sp. m RMFG-2023 TaxID=3053472 RepID=UPI0030E34D02
MSGLFKRCQCLGKDDFSNNPNCEDSSQLELQHQGLDDLPSYYLLYDKVLEGLHLETNNICEIPKLLAYFSNLKYLNLSENEISAINSTLSELLNLKEMDVSKNNISSIHDSFRRCENLEIINLCVNPLRTVPTCLTQLTNLTQIFLNETQLEELPEAFGNLCKLKILELRENNLTILPKSLCLMSNLQRLDIGNNNFKELPDVIGTLFTLKELWCDMNELNILPSFIGCLKSLDCLDASRNKINHISADISGCTLLSDIHLSFNHLKEIPDSLGLLANLNLLKIDSNQLTTLPEKFTGSDSNIKEIILTNNCLPKIPSWLGNLRNLHTLYLDDNLIEELPIELGDCSSLAIISCRNNRLTQVPEEIGKLQNLRVLNLCDNKLTWLPMSILKLTNITALWLSKNQSNPLIPLQIEFDLKTNKKMLTCILLPQRNDEEISIATPEEKRKEIVKCQKSRTDVMSEVTFQDNKNHTSIKPFSPSVNGRNKIVQSTPLKPKSILTFQEKYKDNKICTMSTPRFPIETSFDNSSNFPDNVGNIANVVKIQEKSNNIGKTKCSTKDQYLAFETKVPINQTNNDCFDSSVACATTNSYNSNRTTVNQPIHQTNGNNLGPLYNLSNSSGYSSDGEITRIMNGMNKRECNSCKFKCQRDKTCDLDHANTVIRNSITTNEISGYQKELQRNNINVNDRIIYPPNKIYHMDSNKSFIIQKFLDTNLDDYDGDVIQNGEQGEYPMRYVNDQCNNSTGIIDDNDKTLTQNMYDGQRVNYSKATRLGSKTCNYYNNVSKQYSKNTQYRPTITGILRGYHSDCERMREDKLNLAYNNSKRDRNKISSECVEYQGLNCGDVRHGFYDLQTRCEVDRGKRDIPNIRDSNAIQTTSNQFCDNHPTSANQQECGIHRSNSFKEEKLAFVTFLGPQTKNYDIACGINNCSYYDEDRRINSRSEHDSKRKYKNCHCQPFIQPINDVAYGDNSNYPTYYQNKCRITSPSHHCMCNNNKSLNNEVSDNNPCYVDHDDIKEYNSPGGQNVRLVETFKSPKPASKNDKIEKVVIAKKSTLRDKFTLLKQRKKDADHMKNKGFKKFSSPNDSNNNYKNGFLDNLPKSSNCQPPPSLTKTGDQRDRQNNNSSLYEVVLVKQNNELGFSVVGGGGQYGETARPNNVTNNVCKYCNGHVIPPLNSGIIHDSKTLNGGVYVNKILRAGPAYSVLKPKDMIVSVNGINFAGLTHEQAVKILKSTDNLVKMKVVRESSQ